MTRIFAVVSQKGGVGKTSLVQNLGAELARTRNRVLLVDFDPQSNLTTGWGVDPGATPGTVYDAMSEPQQTRETIVALRQQLHLIPANLDLAGAELAFINAIDRNTRLRKALQPVAQDYDLVLVDGPPSLGFFTVNALAAADEIIIPLQVHPYAYRAVDQLLTIVEQVQEINPRLRLTGIALTMYDRRNSLTVAIEDAARQRFGDLIFKTVIPINVRVAEATLDGISVGEYEATSAGAQAYEALAKEVIDRGP
ncbi:MAG TPA: ParA family protein [Candidatus Binatia bacterium]|jgi:chromosome partitioning protein|nr:ParA family protein [Candidatus Binatia bacterium]